MKNLLIGICVLMSTMAVANDQLVPGTFTTVEEVREILSGEMSNLKSKTCPSQMLSMKNNVINLAMGSRLIGIEITGPVHNNGEVGLYISPIFDKQSIDRRDGKMCVITNVMSDW